MTNPERALIEEFTNLGESPGLWMHKAEGLRKSAEVLFVHGVLSSRRLFKLSEPDHPMEPNVVYTRDPTPADIDALHSHYSVWGAAFQLLGSSVECLLKAFLRSAGFELVDEEGGIKPEFRKHNLRHLAEIAGIEPNERERKILDSLTEDIEWRGRYQVPANWKKFREARRIDLPGTMGQYRDDAFKLWDEIWEKLHS